MIITAAFLMASLIFSLKLFILIITGHTPCRLIRICGGIFWRSIQLYLLRRIRSVTSTWSGSKPQPLIKNNKNKSNNIEAKTLLPNSSVLLELTPTSPVVIVTASMGQTYTNITTSSLLSLSTSPVPVTLLLSAPPVTGLQVRTQGMSQSLTPLIYTLCSLRYRYSHPYGLARKLASPSVQAGYAAFRIESSRCLEVSTLSALAGSYLVSFWCRKGWKGKAYLVHSGHSLLHSSFFSHWRSRTRNLPLGRGASTIWRSKLCLFSTVCTKASTLILGLQSPTGSECIKKQRSTFANPEPCCSPKGRAIKFGFI